jgi:chemotaxis protein methyltransferase CheR
MINRDVLELERQLYDVMSQLGCPTPAQLADRLRYSSNRWLWNCVLDAVLVKETFWFRDALLWRALEHRWIPELLNRAAEDGRCARVWSAGTATGQEAYSLAILVDEVAARYACTAADQVAILGTDLSASALAVARRGQYDIVGFWRGISRERRDRYFREAGSCWEIECRLAERVSFEEHNLMQPLDVEHFDLILCRNVLVYFDPDARSRVIGHLVDRLRPDGYLILGAREHHYELPSVLEPDQTSSALNIYRRR